MNGAPFHPEQKRKISYWVIRIVTKMILKPRAALLLGWGDVKSRIPYKAVQILGHMCDAVYA